MDLQKIWSIELDILNQIDKFCKLHHLKYSLAYGTLIGAVRHGGFIPWDDDIDIVMPRKDYEYLLENWNIPGYILQNKKTNNDYNQNFTKIRKDHTTFIQHEYEKYVSYHTGIFVDIFPGDRIAPKGILRKIQYFNCALDLLYSRDGVTSKKQSITEKILMILPRSLRMKTMNWCNKNIQKWNGTTNPFFFPSTIKAAKVYYSADLFDQMIQIEFAGNKYMCVKKYDRFLRDYYGDYMTLPPLKERTYTHHPIVVDFEKNFKEIL